MITQENGVVGGSTAIGIYMYMYLVEKRLCGQPRQLRALVRLVLISSMFKQQVKYDSNLTPSFAHSEILLAIY